MTHTRWKRIAAAALLGAALPADAAEVDGLTGRRLPLRDSRAALEARFAHALRAGVERANRAAPACDEAALYDALRSELASPFVGHWIAEMLEADPALARRRVRRADSIYRDLGWLENPSVRLRDLSSVVRVGDTLLGLDKLGHFFVEGWRYFEIAQLEGHGVEAALDWGERTERTYFGLYTTGVYSHADLVANLEGMRFWAHLVGRASDPLDAGWRARRPYVACRRRFWLAGERRWTLLRDLDLARYVGPAWDEAHNCSAFRSPEIEAKVAARRAALAAGDDGRCPLAPDACAAARERYAGLAPRLLHPACLAAGAARRPWWRGWRGGPPTR